MESVEEWKDVEEKEVSIVKREEKISENEMHGSNGSSFSMNGRIIRYSEELQSCINEICLTFVYECFFVLSIKYVFVLFIIYRECIDCLECFFIFIEEIIIYL